MDDKSTYTTGETRRHGLSRVQTLFVAVAAGLSVANIYYAQPLLDLIAHEIAIPSAAVGLIVTLTQVGYGVGLIFIVPLGDILNRRNLIIVQGILLAAALVIVATAGAKVTLWVGMGAVGLLAVLVQVLVSHAATLAAPAQRGTVVGTVTSGVVAGILAARSVAGVVADIGGWRAVYMTSALLSIVMVGVLIMVLPRKPAVGSSETYIRALLSIPGMFLREPILLFRGFLALLIFASFSTFWTALVLPLSAPAFSYSHTQIGLFGLVGLAGVVGAACAGRLADRGFGQWTTGISLTVLLGSWWLIAFLPSSITVLLVGVFLLDFAIQAVHVTNLSIIVPLHPQKSSRLIGGYMVFYSAGSAIGAIASTVTYSRYGWSGVSVLGAVFSGTAFVLWITSLSYAVVNRRSCSVDCHSG